MGPPPPRAVAFLAGAVPLALALLLLQRPAPLFLNLGAGDAPFARGFRGGWERDGLQGSGETMFRWTQDGARLEWPVRILSGEPRVRIRVARFLPSSVDVTALWGDGGAAERWQQRSRGWSLREWDLGAIRGPLALQFRSESPDPDGLGVALDWAEVRGAERVWPTRPVLLRLTLLLLALPPLLALGSLLPVRAALVTAAVECAAAAIAIGCDRLGGLVALAAACGPVLLVAGGLVLASRLGRSRGRDLDILVPGLFALVALVALSHPFYYYPDVDTHARYLAAVRDDASLLWDATPYQLKTGAWTREIAGHRVAFPYSPAFHVLAWPLALFLGEVAAVKTVAVAAVCATLLLARSLALAAGLEGAEAATVPVLLATLPVIASRLTLALYPALLGQALELLLLLQIARQRSARVLAASLFVALAAYTGSLINVSFLVAGCVVAGLAAREPRPALRLAALHAAALSLVVAILYARFVPVLLRDVLPNAATAPGAEASSPILRLHFFYDTAYPILAAAGLALLRPGPVRRALAAALLAGLALLLLRGLAPVLVRDAKEVELLAAPVAICTAAALAVLARRGRAGFAASALLAVGLATWGAWRAAGAYAERFVAVGR